MPTCQLFLGDCLEEMNRIADGSIDLVCCDLPYQSTQCSWDKRIDLKRVWGQYRRVLAPRGAIVLNADLRLACDLMLTAPKGWFRYDLVWDKLVPTGFLDCNRRPLRQHELILVFSPQGYPTYNPQMKAGKPYRAKRTRNAMAYGDHAIVHTINEGSRYPISIIKTSNNNYQGKPHPTAKPIDLTDWLISTYSDHGDTVLDNTAGSFTTGFSALSLGRNFIGIELDPIYFEAGKARLASFLSDQQLPPLLPALTQ